MKKYTKKQYKVKLVLIIGKRKNSSEIVVNDDILKWWFSRDKELADANRNLVKVLLEECLKDLFEKASKTFVKDLKKGDAIFYSSKVRAEQYKFLKDFKKGGARS